MTTILTSARITTLAELERFCEDARTALEDEDQAKARFRGDTHIGEVVMLAGAARFELVRNTLTDGSTTYDIALTTREEDTIGNTIVSYPAFVQIRVVPTGHEDDDEEHWLYPWDRQPWERFRATYPDDADRVALDITIRGRAYIVGAANTVYVRRG